ncbi:hypothetical protein Tco_0330964 [Tanacetum coccineum]
MYKVTKQLEPNAKRAKSVLPSTGLSAASSVRRPLNRDLPLKNSVLSNTKKSSEKVEVSVRTNKKTYVASKNVVSNKKIVTHVDVQNSLEAKDVLCVSCAKNMLIPCHDKCPANYKLNVQSKVRRALFTTPRTAKYAFIDTIRVVSKTRFSVKTTQSKSLDTTFVVSKTKIAAITPLSARNKIVDSGCSKHMTGDRSLLKNFVEKFMGTVCFGNDHFAAITGYGDYVQGNIIVCHVYYVEGLGHNLFSVGQFCDGDLEVAFRSNTCYVRKLKGDDLLTGARESNLYTISILDMAASSPVSESMNTPSKEDLDNLFVLMYEEYFEKRSFEVSINSASQQVHNHEDSPLTSLIIVEDHEAPPIVTTSDEQISLISINKVDELNQEDSADFDGNTVFVPYDAPNFE